jgi:hypothetical protein
MLIGEPRKKLLEPPKKRPAKRPAKPTLGAAQSTP